MAREEAINFLKGYLDEEVYTEKCRNAHKMAIDALEQEPSGDLISRHAVIEQVKDWMNNELKDKTNALHYLEKRLNGLFTVSIPPDHDGCKDCRWQSQSETEMPCKQCMHNYTDEWEMEKPTETITMTREKFSEKLMEHYRQGRADEKAYQNGEIMQSFNPD